MRKLKKMTICVIFINLETIGTTLCILHYCLCMKRPHKGPPTLPIQGPLALPIQGPLNQRSTSPVRGVGGGTAQKKKAEVGHSRPGGAGGSTARKKRSLFFPPAPTETPVPCVSMHKSRKEGREKRERREVCIAVQSTSSVAAPYKLFLLRTEIFSGPSFLQVMHYLSLFHASPPPLLLLGSATPPAAAPPPQDPPSPDPQC